MRVLNLGAGNRIVKGAVNHDLYMHRKEIIIAHDLNLTPWPWNPQSFDSIIACSVFEHLEIDLVRAMDECWRILRPMCCLQIKLPYWQHDNAYADPTHRWRYSPRALDVFIAETKLGLELSFYTQRKWVFVKKPTMNKFKSGFRATLQVVK